MHGLAVGDQVALTFPGMKPIAGQIVRGGETVGVCFMPVRLRPEELRELVTKPSRAAYDQPPVTLIWRDSAGRRWRRSITKSWPLGLRPIASSIAA